jgi:hypothetical protein
MAKDKTLLERCLDSDFHMTIHGIDYCRLAFGGRRVECEYLSPTKDHNMLYPCILTAYFNTGLNYPKNYMKMK